MLFKSHLAYRSIYFTHNINMPFNVYRLSFIQMAAFVRIYIYIVLLGNYNMSITLCVYVTMDTYTVIPLVVCNLCYFQFSSYTYHVVTLWSRIQLLYYYYSIQICMHQLNNMSSILSYIGTTYNLGKQVPRTQCSNYLSGWHKPSSWRMLVNIYKHNLT